MHAEFNCINPTLVALTESYLARWTLVQLVAAGRFRIISLRNVIRPETSACALHWRRCRGVALVKPERRL